MQLNSESCVYVEGDDVVYGVQDLNDTSLFDEYSYYGAPQSTTFSGDYFFDNQEQSYDYGVYHYENYPVYYLYPTYPGYYALTNPQYGPENVYNAYYAYVPVNTWYYVPYFVYYLPTSTNNVNDVIYDVDSNQSYQSDVMTYSMEQSFDNSQEFNSNFYNIGNRSSTESVDSCNEIVGEGITTCELFYDEYPQTLNDAPMDDEAKRSCINTYDSFSEIVGKEMTTGRLFYEVYPAMLNNAGVDDEDKSMSSNENLENEAEVNENITAYEESYSIEANLFEDDVDRNVIKKISSMSIDDVKEDIDDNYENAKAFVYSEVLKGYTEIKNQLEELDWECHSLEDILEEEEPESDHSEMDFNENVVEDLVNTTLLAYEDEVSHFAPASCSEESQVDSNEENLVKDHQITMEEETQLSADPLVVEEKDETDPFLELCLSKENLPSGSLDSIEERYPPVTSSAIQGKDETGPFLEQSVSKAELHSGPVNSIEEHHSPEDSSIAEENCKTDTVPQLSLKEDEFDSGSRSILEELHTKMSSEDRGEGELHSTPDILAPAAPKAIKRKKRFSGLRKFLARMCCCVKKKS